MNVWSESLDSLKLPCSNNTFLLFNIVGNVLSLLQECRDTLLHWTSLFYTQITTCGILVIMEHIAYLPTNLLQIKMYTSLNHWLFEQKWIKTLSVIVLNSKKIISWTLGIIKKNFCFDLVKYYTNLTLYHVSETQVLSFFYVWIILITFYSLLYPMQVAHTEDLANDRTREMY